MNNRIYFVSRQVYWPDGQHVVEIVIGGRDYANPNMLVPKYSGEGKEYSTRKEAVEVAKSIRDAWQSDSLEEKIQINYGHTGGYSIPFTDDCSDEELDEWAELDEFDEDEEDEEEDEEEYPFFLDDDEEEDEDYNEDYNDLVDDDEEIEEDWEEENEEENEE